MSQIYKRLLVVNIFGGFFYLFCLIQWLWTSLPYLPGFISFATKLQPAAQQPVAISHTASLGPPSLFITILAIVIVIAILAATAYALVKLPIAITKTGEKITKQTSSYLVPVVSHHAKLTPKKHRALATRLVIDIKLVICTLPVAITALGAATSFSISYDITMLVAALMALTSLSLLIAQVGCAKALHVPFDKMR